MQSCHFFLDNDFVDKVISITRRPFVVEITSIGAEVSIEDYNKVIVNINKIKRDSVLFWLDDYSHRVPDKAASLIMVDWDCIKIDKDHLDSEDYLKVLIKMMLKRFRYVVVEGIENREQFDALTQFHVLLQGYFISRPLPIINLDSNGFEPIF
ncbi:EAL domain-containing protein [Vibrio scophthalmi]|uniref:hypothetical protein n=1 Tax=Vibrio scophthalmi TaxID=45658 RepID=UPI0038734AAF